MNVVLVLAEILRGFVTFSTFTLKWFLYPENMQRDEQFCKYQHEKRMINCYFVSVYTCTLVRIVDLCNQRKDCDQNLSGIAQTGLPGIFAVSIFGVVLDSIDIFVAFFTTRYGAGEGSFCETISLCLSTLF